MKPSRRQLLRMGAGLSALALGCGSVPASFPGTGGAKPTDFPLAGGVPGFRDVGAAGASGGGREAPVLVQLSLNVNDFMRPEREAQAVADWLDRVAERNLGPLELSLTGHVLEAFAQHAPDVVAAIAAARPTLTEHYRLLEYRNLLSTERELYDTDPRSLSLERSQPGPAVRIMQAFDVVPRDQGGVIGELLRARWTPGDETRALLALGFDQLRRTDRIAAADRVVAWALGPTAPTDGHPHVEAYLSVLRLADRVRSGGDLGGTSGLHTPLYRLAQVVAEQGFDLSAVDGLDQLLDVDGVPELATGGFADVGPGAADRRVLDATRAKGDAALSAAWVTALQGLSARLFSLPTLADELRFKLSRLNPGRVYATRWAYHASNDYTVESWSDGMAPRGSRPPLPLKPAATRDRGQQAAIADSVEAVLDVLAQDDRARLASLFHDSQWDQRASGLVKQVFGVELSALPGALSPGDIDALARKGGLAPSSGGLEGRDQRGPRRPRRR